MNNNSTNTGLIFGGFISIIGIILLSTSNNTLPNTIIDSQTNIFENKKCLKKLLKIKVDPEYLEQINLLIIKESGLDKDPYDRKPGLETVKIFSKIAKYHGIKLSDLEKQLDSKTFDFLYKQLVKFQITTNKNK